MNRIIIKEFRDKFNSNFKLRINFSREEEHLHVDIYFDNPKINKDSRWFHGIMGVSIDWNKSVAIINDFRLNYANGRFLYYYGTSIYNRGIGTKILEIVEDLLRGFGIKKIESIFAPLIWSSDDINEAYVRRFWSKRGYAFCSKGNDEWITKNL